jgi:hypothetical protein
MHGLRRRRDGEIQIGLAEEERELLRQLCLRLAAEVEGGGEEEGLARLFPVAYRDDKTAAAEFDELVRPGLAEGKVAALRRVGETAGSERLDERDAQAWLTALNDVRLVLGTRLGVTEETYATGSGSPGLAIYGWLTWLQGELVEALAAAL